MKTLYDKLWESHVVRTEDDARRHSTACAPPPASQTRAAMGPSDNTELIAEVRRLRQEVSNLRVPLNSIERSAGTTATVLDQAANGGQPITMVAEV
eukprot:gene38820-44002_t